MIDNGHSTVSLGGKDHPITLPAFAEREDIAIGYHTEAKRPRRQSRALIGALGLCVPAFGLGGQSLYEDLDLDLVKYGGRVYSSAMAQGLKREEIIAAATICFTVVCASLFPREAEVDEAANFTDQQEAPQT
jgi:hypothetical protein|tara:strand:- start:3836 stop:4231 length:396 start_codon:yes stop_codon:yes gene_type:complete